MSFVLVCFCDLYDCEQNKKNYSHLEGGGTENVF
jgi:hypothetical protein